MKPLRNPFLRLNWRRRRTRFRAALRDTFLLIREFWGLLLLFSLVIIGSGLLYYELAARAGEAIKSQAEAIYLTLLMTFLQSASNFPRTWYLQLFYFVMPGVGLGILAQGLADFGVLLFNRRSRTKEWEMAVASTFSNHVVVVGLGHLGYRVVQYLCEIEPDIVVIESNPQADLLLTVRALGVSVIEEDGTREMALRAAGVQRARAIVLCTQNDAANLKMALKARTLNPHIRVIIRIFDDDFAHALEDQFGFRAFSAAAQAAPVFAAAAAGVDITRPITVEGQALSLARLDIHPRSDLVGMLVERIEEDFDVSVVLLRHQQDSDLHPAGDLQVAAGDTIAVLGGPAQISRLVNQNR